MTRTRRFRAHPIALAIVLAGSAGGSSAAGLGEAELHSYIGSPLRVEIPLRLATGETIDDRCITLVPLSSATDPNAVPLTLQVIHGDRNRLLVQSQRNAIEPYALIRIRMDCAGAALVRDYAVLLDPPPPSGALATGAAATGVPATGADARSFALIGEAPAGAPPLATAANPIAQAGPRAPARTPVPRTASASSRLRLESGLSTIRRSTSGGSGSVGSGMPVLRLDLHMDTPPPVTAALVAQRAQLRDLRALMLSGDDTLERLLALQLQVGTLETQLRGLQSGAPMPPGNVGAVSGNVGGPMAAQAPSPANKSTEISAPPLPVPTSGGTVGDAGAPPQPKFKVAVRLPPPPPPPEPDFDWTLPAAGGAALLLLAGGLWYARRRRAGAGAMEELAVDADEDSVAYTTVSPLGALDGPPLRQSGQASAASARPGADEHASAEEAARAAYLAERFPEIAAGLIQLKDPDSVVNGARLYAETGDHDRAEELLEAAIQAGEGQDVRPWLGLFEVHRLRQQAGAFSALLARFRARFADSRYLPEILAVGRQIDPAREEFAAAPGMAGVDVSADGTTWLNPELDFVPQALARDLHDTLMSELDDEEITLAPMEGKRP
jgi:hypothetical protein